MRWTQEFAEEGGGGVSSWYIDENGIEQLFFAPPIPLEQLLALPNYMAGAIAQIDRVFFSDSSIVAFLQEEVEPFFHGDRGAEDTARILQNRVGTYLAELN